MSIMLLATAHISGGCFVDRYEPVSPISPREIFPAENYRIIRRFFSHRATAEGGVELAKNQYYMGILSEDIRNRMEEIEQQIVSGGIEIPTAFGMSSQEVNALRESVSF